VMASDAVDKSISELLNIPETPVQPVTVIEKLDEVDDDFDYARRNLRDIIEEGKTILGAASDLAKTSEHPRAFEVAGQLISHLASVNKDLIDLKKKRRDLDGESASRQSGTTVNAVFVGSTADLQRIVTRRDNQ